MDRVSRVALLANLGDGTLESSLHHNEDEEAHMSRPSRSASRRASVGLGDWDTDPNYTNTLTEEQARAYGTAENSAWRRLRRHNACAACARARHLDPLLPHASCSHSH